MAIRRAKHIMVHPVQSKMPVTMSPNDDIFPVGSIRSEPSPIRVRQEMTILPADDPEKFRVIGWKVKEVMGAGVVNLRGLSHLEKETERIVVRTPLADSGWELFAGVGGHRTEIVLKALLETDNTCYTIMKIYKGDDGAWHAICVDVSNSSAVFWTRAKPVGPRSSRKLAKVATGRIRELCDPSIGSLLPSERSAMRQIPPPEWEGWRIFLKDVFKALEISEVMQS